MTDATAPYRPAGPTGKQLLSSTWGLLRQDRELLWLPVLATLAGLLAAITLFVPGFALGWAVRDDQTGVWVGVVLAGFASSAVAIYFQSALVIAANERADGGNPTLRTALAGAWAIRSRILKWALVSTTVGAVIRAVEQRLGIVGKVLGFLGGVAWAIATFLVIPVLVAEDLGPMDAVKRSGELIRQTWGTSLRSTLRFGLIQLVVIVPAFLAIGAGAALIGGGSTAAVALGVVLLLIGVVAFLGVAMVASAVTGYARALIYRYATGKPVPGIDTGLFDGVFAPKRRRDRLA